MSVRPTSIVYHAGRYVAKVLIEELPTDRYYHNLHHTINVVQGVIAIGQAERVTAEELECLLLAAWFHDIGHVETYVGHEAAGARIATAFLEDHDFPPEKTELVANCILATRMPQQPANKLEEIICDADMFHLSLPTYEQSQELLRAEWQKVLGKKSTDEEWRQENSNFLNQHTYFTAYGKKTLQDKKERYCY